MLQLAAPGEAVSREQVLDADRGFVGAPELPQRHLEVRRLHVVRIEVHGDQHEARQVAGAPAVDQHVVVPGVVELRSEEHTSELQSLMRISYAVFCLKKKKK